MRDYAHQFAIEKMCQVLKVSRSGYYAWLHRQPSPRAKENQQLMKAIRRTYHGSKRRYGSPKITEELQASGYQVSRPRVARLMKSAQLKSIIHKRYQVRTTDTTHNYPVKPNLLNRDFKVDKPSEVWVSDITYIPTKQGWLYLTIIMDLYDRKIIGWSLSRDMTAEATVCSAWRMACCNRSVQASMIFHSDQGVQYACQLFTSQLKALGVRQSMSRKGDCWDNAVAENFFKILKSEIDNKHHFKSFQEAKNEIFSFIEIWYNRQRSHSKLGYLSPEAYGNQLLEKVA